MGKKWDGNKGGRKEWIAWMEQVMRECLRVMKPGAHGLVWSLPRTSHWTATALEEAGFEIRDCVYHVFGSGFPKSLDVSKAIDKAAGAERERISRVRVDGKAPGKVITGFNHDGSIDPTMTLGSAVTDAAKQWQGFGTALKPAVETWWLIRKPLSEKTVAANVLKWGTGALNIDGSRIEAADAAALAKNWDRVQSAQKGATAFKGLGEVDLRDRAPSGRFPSHLLLSCACEDDQHELECAVRMLDEQSLAGGMHGAGKARKGGAKQTNGGALFGVGNHEGNGTRIGDTGGASRFFYCAKVSASERNAGLEGMPEVTTDDGRDKPIDNPFLRGETERKNHHPTVKPQKLMRYLARLICPPGGTILDPFMGSGSTGVAALKEKFKFIGIEKEKDYFKIAQARIGVTA